MKNKGAEFSCRDIIVLAAGMKPNNDLKERLQSILPYSKSAGELNSWSKGALPYVRPFPVTELQNVT